MPEMNEIPEAAAQRYIDTNQVPTDIGYDWKPFLTAIFERVCLGFQRMMHSFRV